MCFAAVLRPAWAPLPPGPPHPHSAALLRTQALTQTDTLSDPRGRTHSRRRFRRPSLAARSASGTVPSPSPPLLCLASRSRRRASDEVGSAHGRGRLQWRPRREENRHISGCGVPGGGRWRRGAARAIPGGILTGHPWRHPYGPSLEASLRARSVQCSSRASSRCFRCPLWYGPPPSLNRRGGCTAEGERKCSRVARAREH